MKLNRRYLCVAMTLVFVKMAWAAQEETMTVWASPATATNVLEQKTLKALDKQNVAEALSVIAGVSLQKLGARNELQVRVRGFDSRQVPVYFDGIPIYTPYDGNLDLGRFLMTDVNSLDVSKGYTSLLQGPNQMGGSINITTIKPTQPIEGVIGYRQSWSRSKDNAYDTHASLGSKSDIGYIQVSGSRLKQRFLGLPHGVNKDIAGTDGKMVSSSADDKRGIVKIGFTPRISDEYVFTYIKQDGKKDNPPYAGSRRLKPRYWKWPEYDKESYYYQGITKVGDRVTLKSRAYHDVFENTLLMYSSLDDMRKDKGKYSHYSDYSNGAGLQFSVDLREVDILSFAVHWKDDIHREKGSRHSPYDRYKDRTWSMASEYQWAAMDNLDVVAGISYDWRDSRKAMKNEKNGSITHYDDNVQHTFNWQVMAKYRFDNDDTLSLSFSDRSRFPTLKERYTTSKPAYGQLAMVNPDLQEERVRGVDLTYNGHLSESLGYDISLYYNRLSDAILVKNIDANTVQNQNSGRVDYLGVDLGIKGSLIELVDVGLNYSLIHSDPKNKRGGKITGSPKQSIMAWATIKPWDDISFTLSEQARSSSYSSSDGKQKAAGFATTHLRADYRIWRGLSVNATINNLFDTQYAYSEGFMEQGRNYWVGVEYKF